LVISEPPLSFCILKRVCLLQKVMSDIALEINFSSDPSLKFSDESFKRVYEALFKVWTEGVSVDSNSTLKFIRKLKDEHFQVYNELRDLLSLFVLEWFFDPRHPETLQPTSSTTPINHSSYLKWVDEAIYKNRFGLAMSRTD